MDDARPLRTRACFRAVCAACWTAAAMPAAPLVAAPLRAALESSVVATVPDQSTVSLPPNIVLILADDMGFSDLGSYGGEIPTPNLDRLAQRGVRFTQFYNAARCSPSRASLLTGLYPHQAGMGHLEDKVLPGSRGTTGKLAERAATIAEVLRRHGYFTALAGKWHLGISHGVGPWQRGFDRSITTPRGGGLYFPDQTGHFRDSLLIDGEEIATSSPRAGTGYWYSSDLFVDWSRRYIQEAAEAKKPFFLYLTFNAPHFPLMAPPESIARFKGTYREGWDAARERRLRRMKALGIVPPSTAMTKPLPDTFDWKKLGAAERKHFDTMMAVYAAAVFRMDQAIGDLVAQLQRAGTFDNTVILFLSDNGGTAESGPGGRAEGAPLGSSRSTIYAGMNWATLQNTPFRYFKHFTEEGGIATPLIVSWPAGIPARLEGTLDRTPAHLIDIMPTLIEISGARYPRRLHGTAILPMEGVSLLPSWRGQAIRRGKPLFWEHEGNRAVRDGRWKLVGSYRRSWQLFDLAEDRSETRDLAPLHPARMRRMAAQWDAWAERSFVDAWQGPVRTNWGDLPERTPMKN